MVQALPLDVYVNALVLFVIVGLAKALGLVREDGWAAAANIFLGITMNGGFATLTDVESALTMSATSVVAAFYYAAWRGFVKPKIVTPAVVWVKKALEEKRAAAQ
jgi:hypothetical protein